MDNPFPELARRFVESTSDSQDQEIAIEAARLLQVSDSPPQAFNNFITAPREYIQAGDDENQITRAKAYSFLASTIGHLPHHFLLARQVNFLVPFFVSVYSNDVRGGVTAATDALIHLSAHDSFTPRVAIEVLEGIPKLGDDFKKQDSKTRLRIYRLILLLLQSPAVIMEVERAYGQNISFFSELLKAVQVERDATCLMEWFKIIELFLTVYNPAPELTSDIFELFSASYFPISIRNSAHPSGITTKDLKQALRNCFTAHNRLAEHSIPFLLEKLNSGEVSKAEIKLDILNTLEACITRYTRADTCIVPHVDAIWTNLKFEVRNGEVDSTIAATIDVLRSLAKKLNGTDLVRYCSSVQQDCTDDLKNNNFTAQAGKLLLSALSAKAESFGIMVSPTLNSVMNELRHASSEKHTQKLLSLAGSIINIRSQLRPAHTEASTDVEAFEHTAPVFKALYNPLRQTMTRSLHANADDDTLLTGTEAAKALASLLVQGAIGPNGPWLLEHASIASAVSELLDSYKLIVTHPDQIAEPRRNSLQVVHDDLQRGLQHCFVSHPAMLPVILERIFSVVHDLLDKEAFGWERSVETLLRDAASISTDIAMPENYNVTRYVTFLSMLLSSMERALKRYQPDAWTYHIIAAQEAWIYMIKAWEDLSQENGCPKFAAKDLANIPSDPRFQWDQWVPRLRRRYPDLPIIQDESAVVWEEDTGVEEMSVTTVASCDENDPGQLIDQSLADIHRLGLYFVRELYRSITEVVPETQRTAISTDTRYVAIQLIKQFTANKKTKKAEEDQFLITLSEYTKAVVSKLHVRHQLDLFLADEVVALFHSNEVIDPDNFRLTRNTEHIANLEGFQVRNCLMPMPIPRLEDFLSQKIDNLRCPPIFPINGLNKGRILTLSYGIFAPLQSYPNSGAPGSVDGAFGPWGEKSIAHRLMIAGLIGLEHPKDSVVEGYLFAMLASLGNKFQVESMIPVSTMIPTFLKFLADPVLNSYDLADERWSRIQANLGEANNQGTFTGKFNKDGRVLLAHRVLAILAGMLRRPKSPGQLTPEMRETWKYVDAVPRDPILGHKMARAMEVLFTKNDALKPELHSHISPLWLQRAYTLFVESWIDSALPKTDERVPATNCTIAALGALINMPMAIWEDRTDDILKMCLCVMTSLPMGPDLARAVQLLKTIHDEDPEAVEPFLDSVIVDCVKVLRLDEDCSVPDWLPSDFQEEDESEAAIGHAKLACVSLLGAIAVKQNRTKLRSRAPLICRELRQASAMNIREVRQATIKARQAWEDVLFDRPARQ